MDCLFGISTGPLRWRLAVVALVILSAVRHTGAASEHYGQVTFTGLPVPGATVIASQGERRVILTTDQQGLFRLADPTDGAWTIRVEMIGFATLTREVTIGPDSAPSTWELVLLPFEEIARGLPPARHVPPASTSSAAKPASPQTSSGATGAQPPGRGFQRADVNVSPRATAAPGPAPVSGAEEGGDAAGGAAEGFLINGSVNNGAASPFAQPAAFGNNRRRPGALYNFGFGVTAANSAWDARPFSFTGSQGAKPSYGDVHVVGTFGGPIKIPGIVRNFPNVFVGYQHTSDHTALTQPALMPTALERAGDFSQSRDALGRPVQLVNPWTGAPFAGAVIRKDLLSAQAQALLRYYPLPNADGLYNYQAPIVTAKRQDSIQSRVSQVVNPRNQIFGTVSYQQTTTDAATLFGFDDTGEDSTLDVTVNWMHRFNQFFFLRPRYQFTRQTTSATPYFADRTDVSGEAGILGNSQNPVDWGPPSLTFSSGVAGLSDAKPAFTRTQTHAEGAEGFWSHGRHNVTFGGDVRRQHIDIQSQQDPRGSFSFTGAATGSDLADFLLGIPQTSSLAFGNADKYLRAHSYDVYVTDDWRVAPSLTLNVGVRWEFEGTLTESEGRLVNLDVAPSFRDARPVLASNAIGALTGQRYPDSLMRPDARGVQPRTAVAWRPVAGSSLVIRAGYGIYRNTSVYQAIATLLAQQPPLSTAFSVANNGVERFGLANGFVVPAEEALKKPLSTFAVDPDFRVGYAHNWQVSVQRDLPASLTITSSYRGAKGTHLMQEFLPNTYPAGFRNSYHS